MTRAHPQLVKSRLEKLHPTQITVGTAEVALKRKQWRTLGKKQRQEALESHWFPSIFGPGERYYIVDHHHFGLALLEQEVTDVWLVLLKDLSALEPDKFWTVMDHHQWVHPYDSNGVRCGFDAIPKHLGHLQDDPYRSLAGEVRRAGGYAKDVTPFSEFLWADFFRNKILPDAIRQDLDKAVGKAVKLARRPDAGYLPGWSGVTDAL